MVAYPGNDGSHVHHEYKFLWNPGFIWLECDEKSSNTLQGSWVISFTFPLTNRKEGKGMPDQQMDTIPPYEHELSIMTKTMWLKIQVGAMSLLQSTAGHSFKDEVKDAASHVRAAPCWGKPVENAAPQVGPD